jgi:hypothetical protein
MLVSSNCLCESLLYLIVFFHWTKHSSQQFFRNVSSADSDFLAKVQFSLLHHDTGLTPSFRALSLFGDVLLWQFEPVNT